jgi:tetratricopeptide (TPR) repeat protein
MPKAADWSPRARLTRLARLARFAHLSRCAPLHAFAAALALALAGPGCASSSEQSRLSAAAPPRPDAASAKNRIELAPVVVSPYSDEELAAQFEDGRALLLEGKPREAIDVFDRILRLSPEGVAAPLSLYARGDAQEGLGDRSRAAESFRELVKRFPAHDLAKVARIRLSRLLGYLERWAELVEVADAMLAAPDLTVLEAIEARGARALGLVEQERLEEASREVMRARDSIEEHRIGEAGRPPIELAPVSFALGEVRRAKSEQIRFSPLPPNFTDVFEQRCQGLLDAQNAYTDAMRALDAHWSAMAGFRIGQLYEQLHRDVMQITPPPAATTLRKKQLFEGAMRVRYRVLLEKGLRMMSGVVKMGERTGQGSAWIGRAREAERRIEAAIADEKAAIAKLPFTEAELQAGLDSLKTKP